MRDTTINALGFVEVRGCAAAIAAADAMVKTAQVRLLRQLPRDPAQITLVVEGELGACTAAVEAGRGLAERQGAFVAAHVLGRPAADTGRFVLALAEAGQPPFGARLQPPANDDAALLAALASRPAFRIAGLAALLPSLAETALRKRLADLVASGRVNLRRGWYRLAGGDRR